MKKYWLIIILAVLLCTVGLSGCFDQKKQNGGTITADDTDGDGLANEQEALLGTNASSPDSDGDGVYDFFETDDGNATDSDGDGVIDALDSDDDGDSVPTADEHPGDNGDGNPSDALDTDSDSIPNYLDDDDDGDGILTVSELAYGATYGYDVDGDGVLNYLDTDSDDDGKADSAEGTGDSDGDGIPTFLDSDDSDGPLGDLDDDGATNQEEGYNDTIPPDTNDDGTPDYLDPGTGGGSGGSDAETEKFIGSWHNLENEDEHWIFYSDGTQKLITVETDFFTGEPYTAELWFDFTVHDGLLCQLAWSNYGGTPTCYPYEFSEGNTALTLFDNGAMMLKLVKD